MIVLGKVLGFRNQAPCASNCLESSQKVILCFLSFLSFASYSSFLTVALMLAIKVNWVTAGVRHNSGPGDSGSGVISVFAVCVSERVVVCFL